MSDECSKQHSFGPKVHNQRKNANFGKFLANLNNDKSKTKNNLMKKYVIPFRDVPIS